MKHKRKNPVKIERMKLQSTENLTKQLEHKSRSEC